MINCSHVTLLTCFLLCSCSITGTHEQREAIRTQKQIEEIHAPHTDAEFKQALREFRQL